VEAEVDEEDKTVDVKEVEELKLFFGSIEKAIFVQVQGGQDSDPADLGITYNVTSLTKKQIKLNI